MNEEFIGRYLDNKLIEPVMMDEDRAIRIAVERPDMIVFVSPLFHEWAKDKDGSRAYFEMGDYHGGPECLRCGEYFCEHCYPKKLTEFCPDQTHYLF